MTSTLKNVFAKGDSHKYAPVHKNVEMVSKMEQGESLMAKEADEEKPKPRLTIYELMVVLRPYFWPTSGSDGALVNRIRSTSTWFMVAGSKTCNLCAPFYLSAAANDLVAGDYHSAVLNMVGFSSFKLGAGVFKEMQSILYIRVKQQASIQLQELTFTHLHSLSLNWHLSKKTGSVMKSMDRGVDAANSLITYMFLWLIPAMLECVAVMILFFVKYQQWMLGFLIFCGVLLYSLATIFITQWRKQFREKTNKHDNEFHDRATDSIINYETVKYFTGEEFEISRYVKSVVQYQQYSSSTQLSLSLLNISQQVILGATLFGTMVLAGRAVVNGRMNIGDWVACQSWVSTIFVPLNFLGTVYSMIIQSLIDIRNLSELLCESPDVVDAPDATSLPLMDNKKGGHGASVEFQNIFFNYPEQPPEMGLKNVGFYVNPGTTTAVVGHTGAGKTTISRLLFRFYDPRSGSVQINGFDIKKYTQRSVRKAIGIVPQDTVLFNDTILHNISYGDLGASFDEVVAAAEAAQIRSFIETLPEKWNTVVGERGLKLSGGEKQRVAIARCLLKNPPVVLLDEATSALDTITENSIQVALNALGQNRTVLVIAHRLSTIKNADQIVVLDGGKVVEVGKHDDLLARFPDGYYARMWNMQVAGSSGAFNKSSIGIDDLLHTSSSGLELADDEAVV